MEAADYSNYMAWKKWDDQEFGTYDKALSAYFRQELSLCGIADIAGIRVLELGFGNGAFAGWVRRGDAEYVGVEMIQELVDRGRACGFDVKLATVAIDDLAPPGHLDLIVAFDVFEHVCIDDLRSLLRKMHAYLRSGGRLLARVPSGDSPFSRAIQFGDLTHRTVLGSSAIAQLAEQTGFAVEAVREPAFPLRGMGVMTFVRRSVVLLIRRIVFPMIAKAMMGGGRPVLTPNMLFVLVKP
jgi:cyclopropane fatty-acyl-phospholipid synthase-like methyltransferase